MRTRAFIVIAVAALALAGCGDRNLILNVDVNSYLDDSQKTIVLGGVASALIPEVTWPDPIPIVRDTTISLIDGLSDAAEVRSAGLSLGIRGITTSGSGRGTLKLYLSDEGTPPLTTVAAMTLPVTFSTAGVLSIGATDGTKVAELFTKGKLRMAMVLDGVWIAAGGISGLTMTIEELDATIIAGRKAF